MNKQVHKKHYGFKYIHGPRWQSYLLQLKSIEKLLKPGFKILIIGLGDGVVADYLKKNNIEVNTLDINSELKPDFVGNVLDMDFPDNSFDIILCAEVLEHLPFKDFTGALAEIRRVSKSFAVLSLPDKRSTLIDFKIKIPFMREKGIFIKIPNFRKHSFDGQHYWEIGKKGYGLGKIQKIMKKNGFRINKEFTDADCPTIRFFIMEKLI